MFGLIFYCNKLNFGLSPFEEATLLRGENYNNREIRLFTTVFNGGKSSNKNASFAEAAPIFIRGTFK